MKYRGHGFRLGKYRAIDGDSAKRRKASKIQFFWLKIISSTECNELAIKDKQDKRCTMMPYFDKGEIKITTSTTLCVINQGNPKKGVESGELLL